MKTSNILLLVVIIVIIFLVGIAVFWQYKKQSPQNMVKVSIDKKEYKEGDKIKVTVENVSDKTVYYLDQWGFWQLEKYENGVWKEIDRKTPSVLLSGEETCNFDMQPKPIEFSIQQLGSSVLLGQEPITISIGQEWNFRTCAMATDALGNPKEVAKFVDPGVYRIVFKYGLTKDSYNEKSAYSEEFKFSAK